MILKNTANVNLLAFFDGITVESNYVVGSASLFYIQGATQVIL